MKTFVFFLTTDCKSTDRCLLYACYGNPVVRSALGVWPDGHWEIVHGKGAEGERADPWKACFGALSLKGVPEATTDLVVSDGANGLESALA